jgi:hypothetical protein
MFIGWLQLILIVPLVGIVQLAFEKVILAPTKSVVEEQIKVSNSFTNFKRRLSLVGDGIRRMSVSIVNQARRLSLSLNNKVSTSSSSDI